MNKVSFLMAIHFHQPVGNFNFVFEKVCNNSYQPFLESIEEFPDIKLTLHFSGCLLDWFSVNKPEILSKIKRLIKRGQVEIMTGGFYEPILPVIPYNDRIGQIARLTDFVKKNFGYNPQGAWLAERVWEPAIASTLNDAGVKYVILDDYHLKRAGIKDEDIHGYYVTEDQGKAVSVFASDKNLRYSIPFAQTDKVIDYLRSISEKKDGLCAVYGDDAEKFGEWPGTHELVYNKRWLYNFFIALRQNNSWLKTAHLSEYMKENSALGRVNIPDASYEEMGQWSGGNWRGFLTKYPESNQMYKKMLRVSEKIEQLPKNSKRLTPNSKLLEQARNELYKGQCNCAYWHGVFGGLYLYHLRAAVWSHLIKAETIVDELINGKKPWVKIEDEAIISSNVLSLFIDANYGGAITEIDFKPKAINIVNTLSRRKELYHDELLSDKNIKNINGDVKTIHERRLENKALAPKVSYDWYRRASLLDHFFGASTTIENFSRCRYKELGGFVNQPFDMKKFKTSLVLSRNGQVSQQALRVEKAVEIKNGSSIIEIAYNIKNTSSGKLDLWFGVEFNFSMTNDDITEQLFSLKEAAFKDEIAGIGIQLKLSKSADIWRFPIKTISQSETGIEENYQSSVILPNWRFQLAAKEQWPAEICLAF